MTNPTSAQLASMIDHTFLKAAGDSDAVEKLCAEAAEYKFACAMVNPAEVKRAVKLLKSTGVRVGTVIGFPLGQNTTEIKVLEAQRAIKDGARDIDLVINIRRLKASVASVKERKLLEKDLSSFVAATKKRGVVLKLIIECCYLTNDEKVLACTMAKAAGFDFVKTSTGFGSGGATVEDVALMRKTVGETMGVKAAGGISTRADALAMIAAGANRLGCSAGLAILNPEK